MLTWLSQPQLQQTTSGGTATAPQPMQQGGSSSSESMDESSADLVLLASGIPPIPQHLKTIKQGKFVYRSAKPPPGSIAQSTGEQGRGQEEEAQYHIPTRLNGSLFVLHDSSSAPEATAAFELAGYTSIVSNLARESRGQAWMRYDQLFRQAAATNPELQWHKREPDIWLMAVMDAVGSQSTRLVAQQGQTPAGQDKICRRWNRGSCTLPYCRYRHVCFVCPEGGTHH